MYKNVKNFNIWLLVDMFKNSSLLSESPCIVDTRDLIVRTLDYYDDGQRLTTHCT